MTGLDVSAFHFLRPEWLLGILPAAWVALRYWHRQSAGTGWRRRIEPALLDVLLEDTTTRRGRVLAAIVGVALAIASVGLAGPTFARLPQPVEQRSDALVVVLDLSLSMLVADTPPSRIVRARHKIADLLKLDPEGFVGLIAYAGDSHIVAPLTDDRRTVTNLLGSLSPEMMPVLGSQPGEAVAQAQTLLRNAGLTRGRIILLTDGIERISDVTRYATRSMPISILGVGTERGGPIPLDFVDQAGQLLRDDQGRPVIARLDVDRLETVADLCHGRYATLGIGDADVEYLAATPLPGPTETTEIERSFDAWADVGYWAALILVPVALLAFRRGVLVGLVVLVAQPADASWWDDLWQRPDQQALSALERGEPERAAGLFRDPQWRGVADYRSGLFDDALGSFDADPSASGHYNRGNALAHLGRIEEAIAAYDAALTLDPDDEDAAFNKALLQRQLDEQRSGDSDGDRSQDSDQAPDQEPGQQSADGSDTGDPSASAQPRPDGEQQDQDAADAPQEPGQQLAGDPTTEQEARDASDDALEQWLRRVPDDPGGLLRRKFQYETNQRLRRGEYRSRQEERIW